MNTNKLIFSQFMYHLPLHTFRRCVSRYHGNRYVKKFRYYEQYLVLAFSHLTHRESLRDIEPAFIYISNGKLHDVNVLDTLLPEPGAFCVMDRGYLDFARLFDLNTKGAFFVIRTKTNTKFRRRYSHLTD